MNAWPHLGAFLTCQKKMTKARGGWERLELTETWCQISGHACGNYYVIG